jgi:hypothetical protein
LLNDLGPAFGRSNAIVHRIMANSSEFRDLVSRVKVGSREGYVVSAAGIRWLVGALLKQKVHRVADGKRAVEEFAEWVEHSLLPELSIPAPEAPTPCAVRLVCNGVDIRLHIPDLSLLRIHLEPQGITGFSMDGDALLASRARN